MSRARRSDISEERERFYRTSVPFSKAIPSASRIPSSTTLSGSWQSQASILELNNKDADLKRSQVFDRVRRKRLHPLRARNLGHRAGPAAIKHNVPLFIPPYKMTEALDISDPAPAMRVQRHHLSGGDASTDDPHPLILQQQLMVGRRRGERVERIGPRPFFRIRNHGILAHAYLNRAILQKLWPRRRRGQPSETTLQRRIDLAAKKTDRNRQAVSVSKVQFSERTRIDLFVVFSCFGNVSLVTRFGHGRYKRFSASRR